MKINLEKEILIFIKELNDKKGPNYNLIFTDLIKKFAEDLKIPHAELYSLLLRMHDSKKITGQVVENGQIIGSGNLRITDIGMKVFDPFYKKTWRFFTDDFTKILTLISLFLGIILTFNEFLNWF